MGIKEVCEFPTEQNKSIALHWKVNSALLVVYVAIRKPRLNDIYLTKRFIIQHSVKIHQAKEKKRMKRCNTEALNFAFTIEIRQCAG